MSKDHESKENNWKEREEKIENGDNDNNNTIDKNKNGMATPDPDSHSLYSNGRDIEYWTIDILKNLTVRPVQVDRLRCKV